MSPTHQGNLADLWAVGGKQTVSTNVERESWYYVHCPVCGWKLTGKFSTCPRCGADLKTIACPYCRGLIPADAKKCPRCTADIE